MKKIIKIFMSVFVVLGFAAITMAATSPDLGVAERFAVLSSTFTITTATTVNGDVGYTTLSNPGLTIIGGSFFMPSPPQAGLDQATALSDLNSQACTFTFADGAVNLSTDITHDPIGVYTGGVYCINGATSIGTSGIILSGAGPFIFKIVGALDSVDNSVVTLDGGASACDVFWAPTAKTTLGANTTFIGTVIDDAGITIGSTTSWLGRALAFGETVTSNTSTITNTCGPAAGTGMLYVIKAVIGGSLFPSNFRLYVNYGGAVVGSGVGTGGIGTLYELTAGTYTVSEDVNSSYLQSSGTNCSNVTLLSGDIKTCTITNTYITPPSGGGGGSSLSKDNCPVGDYSPSYYDGTCGNTPQYITTGTVAVTTTGTIVAPTTITTGEVSTSTENVVVPTFPKTGLSSESKTVSRNIVALIGMFAFAATSFVLIFKKLKVESGK